MVPHKSGNLDLVELIIVLSWYKADVASHIISFADTTGCTANYPVAGQFCQLINR